VYKAEIQGELTKEKIEQLRQGIEIEGSKTQPARVFIKSQHGDISVLRITLKEGRKRQIRLMIEAIGCKVISLKRLQVGDITLDKLSVGMWRFLKPDEILSLRQSVSRAPKKEVETAPKPKTKITSKPRMGR
jgi:pseudouridine synthase